MCNLARVGYGYIHHLIDYKPVEIEEKGIDLMVHNKQISQIYVN